MADIAFLSRRFLPAEGGVERFVFHLARALSRRLDLRIITQIAGNEPDRPGVDDLFARRYRDYDYEGFQVRCLSPRPGDRFKLLPCGLKLLPGLRRFAYAPLKALAVRRFAETYAGRLVHLLRGVSAIHSFAVDGLGLAGRWAAQELNVPFIITPFVHPGRWGGGKANLALYNASRAVVALHGQDAKVLRESGVRPEVIRICGIGIPAFEGRGKRFRDKHGLRGPLILFVGRLVPHKGYQALARAVSSLAREGREVTLVLLGPAGPEAKVFFDKGAFKNVLYLGRVSEQEKQDAYFACDLFCLPSESEIFPVSLLEAWQAGKPVLLGDIPAHRALVEDGVTGVLAPAAGEALRARIAGFLENPGAWEAMGRAGRERAALRYPIESIADQSMAIYRAAGAEL